MIDQRCYNDRVHRRKIWKQQTNKAFLALLQ